MIFVGIDPGLSGGIAFLLQDTLALYPMPIIDNGKRRVFDTTAIKDLLHGVIDTCSSVDKKNPAHIFVEELTPFKGSKLSCFSMGYGLGLLHATIQSLGLPMTRERPQEWKKHFHLIGASKDASRMKAIELFPARADVFKLKKNEGQAEAALMALYLKRKHTGESSSQ